MTRVIRGIKKRVFKKHNFVIGIDGVSYHYNTYVKMMEEALNTKVGDPIYNPYKNMWDKVAKIEKEWRPIWHAVNSGFRNARVLEITFTTDTGCIIYDVWDRFMGEPH